MISPEDIKDLEVILNTWDIYPSYSFIPAFLDSQNKVVFKFSELHNKDYKVGFQSPFWDIYNIMPKGINKVAGFVFVAKGKIHRFTTKAISSCKDKVSKDFVANTVKSKEWSSNGLDLIRYENAGEVITDLCTIMGVDVTLEVEEEK